MSIYTDARIEKAAEARRKAGAPLGPRIKPVIHFDEQGMFTVWPDKTCAVCAVGLTSRNRYASETLCMEHGRAKQRERVRPSRALTDRPPRPRRPGEQPVGQPAEPQAERPEQDPKVRKLQSLVTFWVKNPKNPDHCTALRDAMQMHELNAYIKWAIPELPAEGIHPSPSPTL